MIYFCIGLIIVTFQTMTCSLKQWICLVSLYCKTLVCFHISVYHRQCGKQQTIIFLLLRTNWTLFVMDMWPLDSLAFKRYSWRLMQMQNLIQGLLFVITLTKLHSDMSFLGFGICCFCKVFQLSVEKTYWCRSISLLSFSTKYRQWFFENGKKFSSNNIMVL